MTMSYIHQMVHNYPSNVIYPPQKCTIWVRKLAHTVKYILRTVIFDYTFDPD